MKLYKWQAECIRLALNKYRADYTHFMCLATPGAGKTMMASVLADNLFKAGLIDLVICLSPSIIVSGDFKEELETQTGKRLDGRLGSSGCSITYQSMLNLSSEFWRLFTEHRVFVIFDEIHHCSGHEIHNANAWGERIISEIQGKAAYTLALTGTPWRTDSIPIALAHYCENQQIHCDYSYGLNQAITDGVCRTPRLTLIDNDEIVLLRGDDRNQYRSFGELLEQDTCSYQSLIENESLITYIIKKADKKLSQLRKTTPNAGGLIVASSVAHARQVHRLLETQLNEIAEIATYQEYDAISIIQQFKLSKTKWIISVGMISEGTNIPRLHVCCHLTRVKTELYFRQVLGRILRVNSSKPGQGFLYMPAEPTLTEFAYRVAEDIPKENVVNFDAMPRDGLDATNSRRQELLPSHNHPFTLSFNESTHHETEPNLMTTRDSMLSHSYEETLNIFGLFKSEVLSFNHSTAAQESSLWLENI